MHAGQELTGFSPETLVSSHNTPLGAPWTEEWGVLCGLFCVPVFL